MSHTQTAIEGTENEMARYSATERIGVNAVEAIFVKELGWIFREQPIADMGIDAHVELVDGEPTGKLLALQIKTGKGNFHETPTAYVYYGTDAHLDYWTRHALPVALVVHLPESGETLWVLVNATNVERTNKGWKIAIPKSARLDGHSRYALERAFEGSPRQQRLRQLSIHEPLMRHIASGKKVSVELEDWFNKSLGRSTVTVFVYDKDGEETIALEWMTYFPRMTMEELAEKLFPWATAQIDEDFYDEHDEFVPTEHDLLMEAIDMDNGIEPAEDDISTLRPYSEASGEVAVYRLELSLGELGAAYLHVADYLDEENS